MAGAGVEALKLFGKYAFSDWATDATINKGWDNTHTARELAATVTGGLDNYWGTPAAHQVDVALGIAAAEMAMTPVARWLNNRYGPVPGDFTFKSTPAAFALYNFAFVFTGIEVHVAADAALNPAYKDDERWAKFVDETGANFNGSAWACFEPAVALGAAALVLKIAPQGRVTSLAGEAFETLAPPLFAYATIKGSGWGDWAWKKDDAAKEGESEAESEPIGFVLPPESSEEDNQVLAALTSVNSCEPLPEVNSCNPLPASLAVWVGTAETEPNYTEGPIESVVIYTAPDEGPITEEPVLESIDPSAVVSGAEAMCFLDEAAPMSYPA